MLARKRWLPAWGKTRTFLRFGVLAKVRFYTKRSPETGYRFLAVGSSREVLEALAPECHQQKTERRNPVALADEWQHPLDTGEVGSRAALARRLGVSRAYVSQTLRLLHMSPEAQQTILAWGDPVAGRHVGLHTLRALASLPLVEQERKVAALPKGSPAADVRADASTILNQPSFLTVQRPR
ncbi:MAG: hypothetical protein HY681_04990 [Chloroflexi bacterium]|nr:hypothetical protein [Chloroflexota bacterium]